MANTTPTTSKVARIYEGSTEQVLLQPINNDIFARTAKQVIEACQMDISVQLWLKEFYDMLSFVSSWAKQHSNAVKACHCSARAAKIVLFFVPQSSHFDFELAEQLVDLNIELSKFNIGTVEIHQIPQEETERFVNPKYSRLIYDEQSRSAPSTVEA